MGKKQKQVAEKAPIKNAAFYKKMAEEIAEAHNILEARLERALEDKEYWFQVADKTHKENQTIVDDIKQVVDETISTILAVHELTGEISPVDVVYNVTMIDRMIQAKYNPKVKQF